MDKKYKAVIMGVGNILWADEGFGNRAVEAFNKKWRTPENVQVIDGGTLGYFLQEFIEETDNILTVELPPFVIMEVTYTEPGLKGNTATNALKPATVESGAEFRVPLFINQGDKIKIDTRDRSYVERAN
jgi:hypothetical protein